MKLILFFLVCFSVIFLSISSAGYSKHERATDSEKLLSDSVEKRINTIVKNLAKKDTCRVIVKISKRDGNTENIGYDGRKLIPLTDFSGTVDIGSATKMFVATAILQQIEQGKLSLETPLVHALPDKKLYEGLLVIDGKDYIDSVRIYHLLNHTSGFADYFYKDDNIVITMLGDSSMRFTPPQLVAMSKRVGSPLFRPGGGFSYSNVNYILLGLIIEKLSGKPYHQYVQENILNPAGMKHTWFASVNSPLNRAPGYWKNKPVIMPATLAWCAGDIISTMDDMTSFIQHWQAGKFFNQPATMELLKKRYYNSMGVAGIEYGLGVINLAGLSWGHAGQTFGYQFYTGILPNGYSFVLAIDDASVSSWEPAIEISALLTTAK